MQNTHNVYIFGFYDNAELNHAVIDFLGEILEHRIMFDCKEEDINEIFSDNEDPEPAENPCPICLSNLNKKTVKLSCSKGAKPHEFHKKCIKYHVRTDDRCPCCRSPIIKRDMTKIQRQ